MKAFGLHILAELSNCNPGTLAEEEMVRRLMLQAAREANAEIMTSAFHKFSPQGISGVVVIAESHLSIHTWPEYGYAAIDIYTCGDHTNPRRACEYLAEKFEAGRIHTTIVERGIPELQGGYGHRISTSRISRASVPA